jgi:class 3 adenylate cyclase/CHASE2 domain-containing sensor protein
VPDQENNTGSHFSAFRQILRTRGAGLFAGVTLSLGIGWILLTTTLGDDIVFYSYDKPFQQRGFIEPKNVVLVYLDDGSHTKLHQSYSGLWNRAFFTQLLKRLTAEKARAVVFDLVFSDPTDPRLDPAGPAVDQEFAQAMQENGNVVLATDWSTENYLGGGRSGAGEFVKTLSLFEDSAADIGSDALIPDNGEIVRQYWPGPPKPGEKYVSEALAAAALLDQSFMHRRFPDDAIKNVRSFAAKLIAAPDPVSGFLSTNLDKAAVKALAQYQKSKQVPTNLETVLLDNLNTIISGPCIYEKARFASVVFRPETKELLAKFLATNLPDRIMTPFNRKLLEDAFPKQLRRDDQSPTFWMNYYGPELILPEVSLYLALTNHENGLVQGYFSNKVVFVGERIQTKLQASRKDEYSTPFSYLPVGKFTSGVAIHATAFLNIIRGDYLKRLDWKTERAIIIAFGILFGAGLVFLRPVTATILGLGVLYPLYLANYFAFRDHHYWFPWAIPVLFQIPIAVVSSVVFNSLQLYVQKKQVEQSLSLYLPARLVKKFASDPTLLKPGAKKQHLTILFSDIAGFTSISEGMDPDELAKLMNAYFQSAVDDCIHYTEGTIVKYIGDAIFAFWNAPDPQENHPLRAAQAALRFRDQDKHEFHGKKVVTRIGLHTGEANVGNFGSTTRVDYTAFGENINLASRMEGLNKYLGTRVLMTGDTYQGIGSRLVTRYLGLFRLKGFEKAVSVYELLDPPEKAERTSELRQRFDQARELFRKKDFAGAEAAFRRVLESTPKDGPSLFYLEHIEHLRSEELPPEWKGEITLKEK